MKPRNPTLGIGVLLITIVAGWYALRDKRPARRPSRSTAPSVSTWRARTRTPSPGDDFFRYANGAWLDRTEIPADKAGYSLRLIMSELTEKRLHEMMQQDSASAAHEPSTLEGKVGAFYKSFMDEARVEALGVDAARRSRWRRCAPRRTRDALAGLMGRSNLDFEGTHLRHLHRHRREGAEALRGLPSASPASGCRTATTTCSRRSRRKKAAYQAYAADLLRLADWPEPEPRAARDRRVRDRDRRRRAGPRPQQRDPDATYNPMSIAELAEAGARLRVEAVPRVAPASARSSA